MREDTLRSFAKYYGLSFVRKNGRANATKAKRPTLAKISAPTGGSTGSGNIQNRPQPERTQQPSTSEGGIAAIRKKIKEGRPQHMNAIQYQDLYRQAWEAQNKVDMKKNPMMEPKRTYDTKKSAALGASGGRPREGDSAEQTMIRRAVRMGMSQKQIGELLGVSERTVGRMINAMAWDSRDRGQR